MKILKRLSATLLFTFLYYSSFAWGLTGHRVVGEIAYRHLNTRAKERVASILKGESMALAANWADFIKPDKSYDYLAKWHFINPVDGLSESAFNTFLHADNAADIYTKTVFLIKQFKSAAAPADSLNLYLKMLIHVVGDAHQPMHVSREKDQGGNKIYVLWGNDTSNLHKVWDDDLINAQQLSYTEYATAIDRPPTGDQLLFEQNAPVEKWLNESYLLCQTFYSEITVPYQRLGARYNYDHVKILNDRLYYAGIRLAAILNEALGK